MLTAINIQLGDGYIVSTLRETRFESERITVEVIIDEWEVDSEHSNINDTLYHCFELVENGVPAEHISVAVYDYDEDGNEDFHSHIIFECIEIMSLSKKSKKEEEGGRRMNNKVLQERIDNITGRVEELYEGAIRSQQIIAVIHVMAENELDMERQIEELRSELLREIKMRGE